MAPSCHRPDRRQPPGAVVAAFQMACPQVGPAHLVVRSACCLRQARIRCMVAGHQHLRHRPAAPRPGAACSGDIRAGRLELSSSSVSGAPITPGSRRTQASIRAIAAGSPPDSTKSPRLTSSSAARFDDPLVDPFEAAAQDHDAGTRGKLLHPPPGQRRAARGQVHSRPLRPALARRVDARAPPRPDASPCRRRRRTACRRPCDACRSRSRGCRSPRAPAPPAAPCRPANGRAVPGTSPGTG